jgi:integrase
MVKVEKEILKDGSIRWRARGVSTGKDPVTGKRTQRTITGRTRKEVEAEVRRIGHQVDKGTYIKPWDGTVSELLDAYLRAAIRGKEANTVVSYRDALRIPRERLGQHRALSVTRDDIEALVDFALTEGRKRGGKPGTGLGVRSVRLMLQQLSAAFEMSIDDRKLAFNPCRRVKVAGKPKTPRTTWSEAELRQYLAVADTDRLAPVWRLLCYGPRRGEVAGLLWNGTVTIRGKTVKAVDLDAKTVAIGPTRVLVDGAVVEKEGPKSENGWRVLPLDDVLVAQLEALKLRQMDEALAAGPAYEGGRHVASDELGRPISPEWLSDEFHRIAARAGVPRIRLHDSRHTANSLMAAAGVPAHIRAAWCGHTQAVNESTYTHARPEDLAVAAAALGKIHNAAV